MSNIERQAISACMKDARDVYAAASAGLRAEMFSEPNLIPVWEASSEKHNLIPASQRG
jgi:hypothetical protein